MARFWRKLDLKKLIIPEDIKLQKDRIVIQDGVKAIENATVFYREALPPPELNQSVITVLLLHGMRFSSKTWLDLETIQMCAAFGHRTLAVDLPGYANTPTAVIDDKAAFLGSLMRSFGLHNAVIISPSMSGTYTLPYLVRNWQNLAGFVPVAPVGIEALESEPSAKDSAYKDEVYEPLQEFLHEPVPDLNRIQTPTMIVFGEKDRSRSSALLNLLPMSQCAEIPNGSHPAYLDNPDLWHQLLFNFLRNLEHTYNLEG